MTGRFLKSLEDNVQRMRRRPPFVESDLKPTSGPNTLSGSWIRMFWEENEFVSSQFRLFLLLICNESPIVKFFLKNTLHFDKHFHVSQGKYLQEEWNHRHQLMYLLCP